MKTQFFPALHALRGFSALWVLLYHVWVFAGFPDSWLAGFYAFGWLGVRIFFVLSAFLLGLQYFELQERQRWSTPVFYRRRFFRIFPAYWFQLVVLMVLGMFTGAAFLQLPAHKILPHLIMWFHLPDSFIIPMNGVWWTLPVEFHFYLLLPLLGWLLLRYHTLALFVAAMAISVAWRWWAQTNYAGSPGVHLPSLMNQLPGMLPVFAAGLIAAARVHQQRPGHSWQALTLGLLGLIASIVWMKHTTDYWTASRVALVWEIGVGISLAWIVLGMHRWTAVWVNNRIAVGAGDLSYGLYLWHLPVILAVRPLITSIDADARYWVLLMVTLLATTLLAWISFRFIELPAMRFARSRSSVGSTALRRAGG